MDGRDRVGRHRRPGEVVDHDELVAGGCGEETLRVLVDEREMTEAFARIDRLELAAVAELPVDELAARGHVAHEVSFATGDLDERDDAELLVDVRATATGFGVDGEQAVEAVHRIHDERTLRRVFEEVRRAVDLRLEQTLAGFPVHADQSAPR